MNAASGPHGIITENVCATRGQGACLHGACIRDGANVSHCVCQDGWAHDILWTRLENCAMPVYFGLCAHSFNVVFGLVSLYVLVRYYLPELRGGARKVALTLTAVVASLTLMSLSYLCTNYTNLAFQFFHAASLFFFGLTIGFFSDTLWIVAQYSLRMTAPSMFDTQSAGRHKKPLHLRWVPTWFQLQDVNLFAIRIAFVCSACIIASPFLISFFYVCGLGNPTDPSFDVVAYNNAVVYPLPALASHNLIFFPTFVVLALFLIQTLTESIDERKKITTTVVVSQGTLHNQAQLEAVRNRIRIFVFWAIVVLAPAEFILLVIVFPVVHATRAPGMYLVLFFSFLLLNFSLSIVLFTLKSRVVKVIAPVIVEAETAQSEWRAQTRRETMASHVSIVSAAEQQPKSVGTAPPHSVSMLEQNLEF